MADEHWSWQFDRTIPSDTAAGKEVLDAVLDALRRRDWPAHDLFGVHLALHEALVNAIIHGNRLDAQKQVGVCCRISPQLVRIEISDEGSGFNPSNVPDCTDPDRIEASCGRGVMLMRAFMSRVEFNQRGNRVLLEKHRHDGSIRESA
jgi:serine/threonine-protein kinase RsbW